MIFCTDYDKTRYPKRKFQKGLELVSCCASWGVFLLGVFLCLMRNSLACYNNTVDAHLTSSYPPADIKPAAKLGMGLTATLFRRSRAWFG